MQAEVKSIISPDIFDLNSYLPEDSKNFSFLLEIVGTKGQKGGDIFSFELLTPQYLVNSNRFNDFAFGRGLMIVFDFNIELILKEIKTYCKSCSGDTYDAIARKISRIAKWEFEDYRETSN